jgi:CubicO group peptidase (beta-lactamase class C family)
MTLRRLAIGLTLWACLALPARSWARAGQAPAAAPDFAAMDAFVVERMRDLHIPGLSLGIVQGNQTVYLQGYGSADPSGRPVAPQTPFRLASVSKPLTAIAVMQLVERGLVELDAPVQRYLPWFRVADAAPSAAITVRHLLYHTSGVPQSAGNDNFFNGDLSDAALEQNVRQLATVALNRPVGSAYEYANLNYDTLGLIVQAVSGQSYEAYVEEHIFEPLDMRHSFTSQSAAQTDGLAAGYRQWLGLPLAAHLPDDRATRPSSFLIASAEDLTHVLIAALNDGRYGNDAVLSPEGMAALLQPAVAIGQGGWHSGMGMEIGEISGVGVAAKTGGTANYNARIVLAPDEGWGVVVLANTFDIGLVSHFDAIANGIMTLAARGQTPTPPEAPLGGGNAAIKLTLLAVAVFELYTLLRLRVPRPPARSSWRWLMRHIGLPLALDLVLICLLLLGAPRLMNAPLRFLWYFAPDLFWLTVAVVSIPLGRDMLKALLIWRAVSHRTRTVVPVSASG